MCTDCTGGGSCASGLSYEDALIQCYNKTITQGPGPAGWGEPPEDNPPGGGTNTFPNPNPTPSGPNGTPPTVPPATPPTPSVPPTPPQEPNGYFSGPSTVTIFCSDGTPFTVNVPAGLFAGFSQAEADASARSYIERNITSLKFCISDFGASVCIGTAIAGTLTITGGTGPFTWTAEGLPPGISLLPSGDRTAEIFGTMESGGTFTVTVRATDPLGNFMEKNFTIIAIGFVTDTLPDSLPFVPYSTTIQVESDEVLDFRLPAGSLPPGLTLDTVTGVISGTPTTPGTYAFVVSIQSPDQTRCLRDFSIHIFPTIGWSVFADNTTGFPTYTIGAVGGAGNFNADCDGGVQDDSVDLHFNGTIFNDLPTAKTLRIEFLLGYILTSNPQPPAGGGLAFYSLQEALTATVIATTSIATPPGGTITASSTTPSYVVAIGGNGNKTVHLLLRVSAGGSGGIDAKSIVGGSFTVSIT